MIRTKFTTRQGKIIKLSFPSAAHAQVRISDCEMHEATCKRFAPSDSGDVRFNCNAEIAAIKSALTQD